MAFEKIELKLAHSGAARMEDCVSMRPAGKDSASVSVGIASNLTAALGLQKNDRVHILRGTGADANRIALRKADDLTGRILFVQGKGSVVLTMSIAHYLLGIERPTKATRLPAQVRDDMIVIDISSLLPKQARRAA